MRTVPHRCTSLLLTLAAGVQAEAPLSAEQLQPACNCIATSSTLISFLLARDPVGKGR
jgi:hypothetical protein